MRLVLVEIIGEIIDFDLPEPSYVDLPFERIVGYHRHELRVVVACEDLALPLVAVDLGANGSRDACQTQIRL